MGGLGGRGKEGRASAGVQEGGEIHSSALGVNGDISGEGRKSDEGEILGLEKGKNFFPLTQQIGEQEGKEKNLLFQGRGKKKTKGEEGLLP